jgi:hypothetical protein
MFQIKAVEKIETYFTLSNLFSENRALYEIMYKNLVEPEGPQMTSKYGAYTLHAG